MSKTIGILGGGFGTYGYLPAFSKLGFRILTNSNYKQAIWNRAELQDHLKNIEFEELEFEILRKSEIIVIARRPVDQSNVLNQYNFKDKILFLEKPLAPTIEHHLSLVNLLSIQKLKFSVGYLAPYTEWYSKSLELFQQKYKIVVNWEIQTGVENWKTNDFSDNGLFSFYGIHFSKFIFELDKNLSNLLIEYNPRHLNLYSSRDIFEIKISLGNRSFFEISTQSGVIYSAKSPFGELGSIGQLDSRVALLEKYICHELKHQNVRVNLEMEKFIIEIRKLINSKIIL